MSLGDLEDSNVSNIEERVAALERTHGVLLERLEVVEITQQVQEREVEILKEQAREHEAVSRRVMQEVEKMKAAFEPWTLGKYALLFFVILWVLAVMSSLF